MKKNKLCIISGIFITFLFVSVCFSMFIQKWYTGDQHTIQWSAVTAFENGSAFPESYTIEYGVYLSDFETDPNKANPTKIGSTEETTFVVNLDKMGKSLVGLQTVCKRQDGYVFNKSSIGWTDDIKIVANELTFGLHYFISKPPFFIIQ